MKSLLRVIASMVMVLSLALPALAGPQHPIGLIVAVQPWTPITDDDTVQFVFNGPSIVSDGLNQGWRAYATQLRQALTGALEKPDLLADGFSLRDVDLQLSQPLLTLEGLQGSGTVADPYRFNVRIDLQGEGGTASITSPTFLGKYADPRCSIVLDATIRLKVRVQNDPGRAFVIDQAPGDPPMVSITRFDFDSHNLICDLPVAVAKALPRVKGLITGLVTDPSGPVGPPLNAAGRQLLNPAVASLNAKVASYQRPELDLLALRVWLTRAAVSDQIVLNLAPRAPLPDPTAGRGQIFGSIRALAPSGVTAGQKGLINCAQIVPIATRKTGPRPMIGPTGVLGEEPLETLHVQVSCSGLLSPGQTGTYRVTGLSAAFPQHLAFGSPGGRCSSFEARVVNGVDVNRVGWGDNLRPQDLLAPHPVTASYVTLACGGGASHIIDPKAALVDPRIHHPDDAVHGATIRQVNPAARAQATHRTIRPIVTAPIEPKQ